MRLPTARRPSRLTLVVLVVGLLAAVLAVGHLASPRTQGLSGEWSASAADGDVVAGRALVSGGNGALDLRTGKSVRLGSVSGGAAFYADERLLVVSGGRIDSVRLDASARWTWQAPTDHLATPLAASGGSTLVADCPASPATACRLVGLDATGKPGWESSDAPRPVDPPRAALPRVHAQRVDGGGVVLTDPVSGRTSLQPGSSFVTVPDGPVVVPVQQGGQCVVSLYTAPDPLWTRVLGPCPGGKLPAVVVRDGAVVLTWQGRTRRLATATGVTLPGPGPGALVATRHTGSSLLDPLRWGKDTAVLELTDARTGEVRARLVTDEPVALLVLEPAAIVVREGDRVVRYTLHD